MKKFSEFLKKYREDQGMLQKDLAKFLGTTQQAISLYEVGKAEPLFSRGCEMLYKMGYE